MKDAPNSCAVYDASLIQSNMREPVLTLLCVALVFTSSQCARILGVFPLASYSHYTLGNTLMRELAIKGHDVTLISPYKQKTPLKNLRDVVIEGLAEQVAKMKMNFFDMDDMSIIEQITFTNSIIPQIVSGTLDNANVQKFLQRDEKFDVVIIEQFMDEALRGLQHRYKAPCIIFSTVYSTIWTNHLVGNPFNPAYIPEIFSPFSSPMNFYQRTVNLLIRIYEEYYNRFYALKVQNELLHKYFPDAPDVYELMTDTALVLLNSHPSLNQPVPHNPNMIEIGGFHVQSPKKLPEDLQKYLDDAKEGVVYFSMGSNLKSADLPPEVRDAILRSFSKSKLKVLWKWETDNLPGQPKNVRLGKWLPQPDILAHPNVKVFITHGGLLSTIEATYYGIPVIGIPIYGDQKTNMQTAVNNGVGLTVPFKELSEEKLSNALNEITTNPKFSENAKKRSKVMHDQPVKPLDSAVFWVEHVVRHKGAEHFRSTALDLNWFQYLMLDVIAFVLIILTLPVLVLMWVVKKIFCKKCKNAPKKKTN